MRNFGFYALALAVAFGATGCVDRKAQEAAKDTAMIVNDPSRDVSVTLPKIEDVQDILEVNGEITTTDDAQISAQASGKITAIYVKEGDMVSAGQTVAMMDSVNLQNQVTQARAALATAQAQLNQASNNARLTPNRSAAAVRQAEAVLRGAKVQLQKSLNGARTEDREQADNNLKAAKSSYDTAKKQLERVRKLVKEGALAESQLDTAQNSYEAAMAQYENAMQAVKLVQNSVRQEDIEAAREQVRQAEQGLESAKASKKLDVTLNDQVAASRSQVESARAQLQVAQKNLSEAVIKSPFSGRVYGKPLQAGVVVSPGTPIARIVGGSGIYFEGQAPSDQISQIQIGTRVTVSVDSFSGTTFGGHVIAISPQGDSVGRLFNVRIGFDAAAATIKPGMFAKGSVVIGENPGAMMVSEDAVISRDGSKYVMVAEGDKAKKVVVTTGIKKGSMIAVKGISSASKVITQGQGSLVDGSKIRVSAEKKGAL